MTDFKLLATVISALGEASQGGEDLDVRISVALGEMQSESAKLLRLFVEEGYDWNVISNLLDDQVPPYTTSLDAAVPGENIVGVLFSRKRGRWAAIHRGPQGRESGPVWAASEALARRAAGLAGLVAQNRKEPGRDRPNLAVATGGSARPAAESPDRAPAAAPVAGGAAQPEDAENAVADAEEEELSDWKILF